MNTRDPRRMKEGISSREIPRGNQPIQSFPPLPPPPTFPLSNVPSPVPQQFPPTNLHPNYFPPPLSRFPSSNVPPSQTPSTFLPQPFPNTSTPFPSQTFQGGPTHVPQWSTPLQHSINQSQEMRWPDQSVSREVVSFSQEMLEGSKTTSQEMISPMNFPKMWPSNQGKWSSSEDTLNKSDAQSEVDNWLKSKRISTDTEETVKKDIQIYAVKEKLNEAIRLIRELENGARTLAVMVKTVTPAEWDRKCEEVEEKKKKLMVVMSELKLSKEEMNTLKVKCSKRSKKRARLRRQAERRKKQKEEEAVKEQNINIQIDNWQREMQEDVERAQREERLQKQADAVLWGVTREMAEARRQVALLSGLLELRQVRVKRLTAAGRPVSQLQIQTFDTVIERLKRMWTQLLARCQLEEQALRGMLIEADIKSDPVKTHKRLVLQEWETALFGAGGTSETTPRPRDTELLDIRHSWDQFAVPSRTVLSSTIPPGWVLPDPPTSDQWLALLKY